MWRLQPYSTHACFSGGNKISKIQTTSTSSRKLPMQTRERNFAVKGKSRACAHDLMLARRAWVLVKGARWLTRGINLEESCKQMCFYRAQWKRLWQSPLESGKAALGGPGPWRSRMSPRKATKRRSVPAAPVNRRKKARPTSNSFSLSHWLLLTAMPLLIFLLFFLSLRRPYGKHTNNIV